MNSRNLIIVFFFVFIVFLSVSLFSSNISYKSTPKIVDKDNHPKFTLFFVGDVMISRRIGEIMEERGDWNFPFRQIVDLFKNADGVFANLENPISTRGKNTGSKYSFRGHPRALEGLKFAGIDVVSIANNHIWDYGPQAVLDTFTHLENTGIDYVGVGMTHDDAHKPVIKNYSGIKIAYLAYTNLIPRSHTTETSNPAVAFLDIEKIIDDIQIAKGVADIVIVSYHWGEEYETTHRGQEEEVAHTTIDAGAKLVIGHHPHVVQEVEKYKQGYIAYSLGNFVFDQNFSDDTKEGLVLEVVFKGKEIVELKKHKIAFNHLYQPYVKISQ